MAFSFKKRDLVLIAIAIAILAFLWQAPPESTSRVPYDDTHRRYHDLVKSDGKKAAEKFCEECHNPDGPLPARPSTQIARAGSLDIPAMRRAIVVGSVLASYAVERFSLDRLRDLGPHEIRARYAEFRRLAHFDDLDVDVLPVNPGP